MPTIIKNNLGVIVSISMWLLTGAVSIGASLTILTNIKENQVNMQQYMKDGFKEVKETIEIHKEKSDEKFTAHDQRITRCETKLESKDH